MKANNQEKSAYSGFSPDPVKITGETVKKEEFTGKKVTDGDFRARKADKK